MVLPGMGNVRGVWRRRYSNSPRALYGSNVSGGRGTWMFGVLWLLIVMAVYVGCIGVTG